MVVVDGQGVPLASTLGSASPAEVKLLEPTLETMPQSWQNKVQRLILDRAYDSNPLRERLKSKGIAMICPHRRNRKKPRTQDGRPWYWILVRCWYKFFDSFEAEQIMLMNHHP